MLDLADSTPNPYLAIPPVMSKEKEQGDGMMPFRSVSI